MIEYNSYSLDNGLRVLLHRDETTTVAAVNLLYDVGSRDEHPEKTGFAHLFEHLMFAGSINIPDYDRPLEQAGGENNAFTGHDLTNYYISIPQNNLETAFWLESDRMLGLNLSKKSLKVQKDVVSEEFRERFLNQPYGDLWLLLRPLAYKVHPYRWDTIGRDIEHIQNATMDDVRDFYEKFYHPQNAILSVVSGFEDGRVMDVIEKWFGGIRRGVAVQREIPAEPPQQEKRVLEVIRSVPFDVITMAFHMSPRSDPRFYAHDMISDILSEGRAARLYENLIKKKRLFTEIDAFITGDIDSGLFVVSGKLLNNVTMRDAEHSIWEELHHISRHHPSEEEMQKVRNRIESSKEFGDAGSLNRAFRLGFAALLGDMDLVNQEIERYKIAPAEISAAARELFNENNCSILYYRSDQK